MSSASSAPSPNSPDPLQQSREGLCSLIPHGGDMCLLECVENWDDDSILTSTNSHKDPGNPLRSEGKLSALNGLEYGAQAMAVHGALLADREGAPIRRAYLAAVHDLRLMVTRLDTEQRQLQVEARRLLVAHGSLVYQVRISAGDNPLVTARVTVMSRPGAAA